MLRQMHNRIAYEFGGRRREVEFYTSTFDTLTGTLVRSFAASDALWCSNTAAEIAFGDRSRRFRDRTRDGTSDWQERRMIGEAWIAQFGRGRMAAFSPSPETLDISITDACSVGCPTCYQSSTPKRPHVDRADILRRVTTFDPLPYQVAIGGGEPAEHPDLPWLLNAVAETGVVPNFTTSGHFRSDVACAAEASCGGIAITYHPNLGYAHFVDAYARWRRAFSRQLNVHLIAMRGVAERLRELTALHTGGTVGRLSVVLLGFYPDVGRGSRAALMSKTEYQTTLPAAIRTAVDAGVNIAFSEALLPYFNSRPELGVSTAFAGPSEGRFSAYVGTDGRLHASSFDTGRENAQACPMPLQTVWREMITERRYMNGTACGACVRRAACTETTEEHLLLCNYMAHNEGDRARVRNAALRIEEDIT